MHRNWDGSFTVGQAVREELTELRVEMSQPPKDDGGAPVAALAAATLAGGAIVAGGALTIGRLRRPRTG